MCFIRRRHPLFMVWTPGQSIGLIKSAGFVDDGEVKLGKEEQPMGMSMGEFLFGTKVGKVVMVGPNLKGLRMPFKVVAKVC
jgi:hypothetical protein